MALKSFSKHLKVPGHEDHISSVWINDDIRPLPPHRRTWTRWAFISFWAINQIALSNWQLGGSLVATGISVWQAIVAIIVGKIIIAMVAIANGYVGATWHIGFCVVSRYVWGVKGQYVALIQRIVLSLVWFAVQSWTGGLCVQNVLAAIFPGFQHMKNHFPTSANLDTKQFIGWVLFNVIMAPIIYIRPEGMKHIVLWMTVVSGITLLCMTIWALSAAHGAGPLLNQSASTKTSQELGWNITLGVTTVIGNIAAGLVNQMDYSRFARRPGDQVFGQWISIIGLGIIMPLFGCLTSSATQKIYGEALWNPPDIVQKWLDTDYNAKSRAAAFFAGCGLVTSQLAINTIDNAFSAGMDIAGLFPSYINIRRGAYIGLIISIALCPWQLLASASTFISVLSAYSVFLGPMTGIMICDYWVVRGRKLKLSDLYHGGKDGVYYFWHGVNWRINPAIDVPTACTRLYYLAFPLGFVVSFSIYYGLNLVLPPQGLGVIDEVDEFETFTMDEAQKLGVFPPVIHGDMQQVSYTPCMDHEVQRPDDKTTVVCK
ncbi:NCS1 nucleoside transporter family, partial [Aureobasidium melanogenum]